MTKIFCDYCHMKTEHDRVRKKKRADIILMVCSDCGTVSKGLKAKKVKKVSIKGVMDTKRLEFEVQDGEKTRIYGEVAELLARNFLKKNQELLIKNIIGEIEGNSTLQIFQTQPTTDKVIGSTTYGVHKKIIYGWNGDFVIIFNNKLLGKSAIIFEVKYGESILTKPQKKFFEEVYKEKDKSCFMKSLDNIKIIIIRIHDFDLKKGRYKLNLIDYSNYRKRVEAKI